MIFNFFKKKIAQIKPIEEPKVGEYWVFVYDAEDPFPPPDSFMYAKIIDVKDNWVRYVYVINRLILNSGTNDYRMSIKSFLRMFRKKECSL